MKSTMRGHSFPASASRLSENLRSKMNRICCSALISGCCFPAFSGTSAQQTNCFRSLDELKQLQLEELLSIEVTTVSRSPEPASDAAAARGPRRDAELRSLARRRVWPDQPPAEDCLNRIKTAAERLDQIIQDGPSYSRILRADLSLAPIDVAALIRGMIETYPSFQSPHAEIEIAEDLPPVIGNEAALTQCVSNILGNAVKFVAPGVTPQVRIRGERAATWCDCVSKTAELASSEERTRRFFNCSSGSIANTKEPASASPS